LTDTYTIFDFCAIINRLNFLMPHPK